jgi:hypothetical protein
MTNNTNETLAQTSASRCRFLKYAGVKVYDESLPERPPLEGDYLLGETIVRFTAGFITNDHREDGETLPAVEALDGHTEWWENGLPHRTDGPAILDEGGLWEEYWQEGRAVPPPVSASCP